jgi:hypothetical protein
MGTRSFQRFPEMVAASLCQNEQFSEALLSR